MSTQTPISVCEFVLPFPPLPLHDGVFPAFQSFTSYHVPRARRGHWRMSRTCGLRCRCHQVRVRALCSAGAPVGTVFRPTLSPVTSGEPFLSPQAAPCAVDKMRAWSKLPSDLLPSTFSARRRDLHRQSWGQREPHGRHHLRELAAAMRGAQATRSPGLLLAVCIPVTPALWRSGRCQGKIGSN